MAHKHSRGPLIVHAQGDANDYCLLTQERRWIMAFRQNGELLNEEQAANVNLIAETFTVAAETGMTPQEMRARMQELSTALEVERGKLRQLTQQHEEMEHALELAHQHIGWCWDTLESNTHLRREGSAAVLKQIKAAAPSKKDSDGDPPG